MVIIMMIVVVQRGHQDWGIRMIKTFYKSDDDDQDGTNTSQTPQLTWLWGLGNLTTPELRITMTNMLDMYDDDVGDGDGVNDVHLWAPVLHRQELRRT